MKKDIVFATHNPNKASEIQSILGDSFAVRTLNDIGIIDSIPETGSTLEENAFIKSSFVYQKFNCNVFSDDTGLEVNTLNGEPGVFSARFAGPNCVDQDNMDLLLKKLQNKTDRSAQFRTVISLFWEGQHYYLSGVVSGKISKEKRGHLGFGYDPIFIPEGFDITFAEMTTNQKNLLSHRGHAITQLHEFLTTI